MVWIFYIYLKYIYLSRANQRESVFQIRGESI
jgi:hypothetical protein